MRTFIILLAGGLVLVAGLIIYWNRQDAPLSPAVVAEQTPGTSRPRPADAADPDVEPVRTLARPVEVPDEVAVVTPSPSEVKPESRVNAAPPSTAFSQALDLLVSPQASFGQKQTAWRQLREAGQLTQAIENLKQGMTDHPTSAAYPAALGQAQLLQAGVVAETGGKINEMGLLGMQADQNFDEALRLNPANWEAQFFKAAAMSHWPLELNKGEEVIQRLSILIDQQEVVPQEPQFAQAYVLLGEQYQKMGQPDYAAATWQIGATRFPGDLTLQKKSNGH